MLPSNLVFSRIIWIVLDSVGIGAMPDAAAFGDPPGADTLGNLARLRGLRLPHLGRLGLGNIKPLAGIPPDPSPWGAFGRCTLASPGKDTTTGHWEMAGIHLDKPFPLYPRGFPPEIMSEFERRIGRRALGNRAASGTEIIQELALSRNEVALTFADGKETIVNNLLVRFHKQDIRQFLNQLATIRPDVVHGV